MKKFLTGLLAVTFVFFAVSCGSDDNSNDESGDDTKKEEVSKLEGTWLIVKAEGTMAETNKGTKYIFKGNTLTIEKGFANEFTFEDKGGTLVYKLEGNDAEFETDYEFKGDQLILNPKNSDQFFYCEKQ